MKKERKWPGYDWKTAKFYDLSGKKPHHIAWEFLRRNSEYLRNYEIYKKTEIVPLIPNGNPNALDMREYFGIHSSSQITDPFQSTPPVFEDEEQIYPTIFTRKPSQRLEKNEICAYFSFDHDIDMQLKVIGNLLKDKQTKIYGDIRGREKPFDVYLRILDADQDPSKPTDQTILDIIFGDQTKELKEISRYRTQAEGFCDGGYRNIINNKIAKDI